MFISPNGMLEVHAVPGSTAGFVAVVWYLKDVSQESAEVREVAPAEAWAEDVLGMLTATARA